MDFFQMNYISLFIIFFIPGFVSVKVWGFIVPTKTRNMNEDLFEVISYSCINFALTSWLIIIIRNDTFQSNHPILFVVLFLAILLIFPIIWPVLFHLLMNSKFVSKFVIHFFPTAWDYHFKKGEQQYVLIHLQNGKLIGGLWGFSSSYPNVEDIYLLETWKVNEKGEFLECIEATNGLWIGKENIQYIEFFKAQTDNNEEGENE